MFIKLDPQPGVGDMSQRKIQRYGAMGLGIMDSPPDAGFISFPGMDPAGVSIVQHKGEWYWARPTFFNPRQPLNQVITTLEPFSELFTDRQMRLIANTLNYVDNDPAGLGGHQAFMLISHLYTLVGLMSDHLNESELARVVEMFYTCHLPG